MKYNLLSGILAAIAVSLWGITILKIPKNILTESSLNSIYIRLIFVVAGILCGISLLLPKYGLTKEKYNKIIKFMDYKHFLWCCLIIIIYQMFIIHSFAFCGPAAQILINLSVILILLYSFIFIKYKISFKIWLLVIIYVLLGLYITNYNIAINK